MTEEILQPDASACGKTNAYYHRCTVVGQTRPYAACLARCDKRLRNDEQCNDAIRIEMCPAQRMRREELAKGQAIYFTKRGVLETIVGVVREWIMPGKDDTPRRRPAAPAIAPEPVGMLGAINASRGDFADAVTRAAEREQAKLSTTNHAAPSASALPSKAPLAHSQPMKRLDIRPGESPLEAMRRAMKTQPKRISQQ